MNHIKHLSLIVLAVTVLACAACGAADEPAGPGPAGSALASSPAAVPASPSETPVPTDYQFSQAPGPQAPEPPAPNPGASWTETAKADALTTATKAMGLFAQPESGEPKWFQNLKPYLTADAAESLSYTDPSNVPVRQVLGAGILVTDPGNPFGAVIKFSTDAGTYAVQVVRIGDAAPWQVATIAPAGNQ